jgi:hypothetical protein
MQNQMAFKKVSFAGFYYRQLLQTVMLTMSLFA